MALHHSKILLSNEEDADLLFTISKLISKIYSVLSKVLNFTAPYLLSKSLAFLPLKIYSPTNYCSS